MPTSKSVHDIIASKVNAYTDLRPESKVMVLVLLAMTSSCAGKHALAAHLLATAKTIMASEARRLEHEAASEARRREHEAASEARRREHEAASEARRREHENADRARRRVVTRISTIAVIVFASVVLGLCVAAFVGGV